MRIIGIFFIVTVITILGAVVHEVKDFTETLHTYSNAR